MPLSPLAPTFRINSVSANNQSGPDLAPLLNGRFAAAWFDIGSTIGDIKLQVFGRDGAPIGGESVVNTNVNGTLARTQENPTITGLLNGGFVVAWDDLTGTATASDIRYRVYDGNGRAVTDQLTATSASGNQFAASIAATANGGFVVAWSGQNVGVLQAQQYNAFGLPVGGPIAITAAPNTGPRESAIANAGQELAFVFRDINNGVTGDGIYARVTTGFPAGPGSANRIDPGTGFDQQPPQGTEGHGPPDVAYGGVNGVTPAYVWSNQFGIGAVRQNDVILNFAGSTRVVNTTTVGDQIDAAITPLPNGGFLTVWTHQDRSAGFIAEIRGQEISATGANVGGEIVFSNVGAIASLPKVAANADGRVLVSWTETGATTNGTDILGRFFTAGIASTVPTTPQPIVGTAGNDVVIGGSGLDTYRIAANRAETGVLATTIDTFVTDRVAGRNGADVLSNIERIRFNDGTLALDTALPGFGASNAGSAYRLYEAAFNRTPDNLGLAFWIKNLDAGLTTLQAAALFISSDEFIRTYGADPSAQTLVTTFYTNILGRAPEQAGFDFWFGILNNRPDLRATVLEGISNSIENQNGLIGTIGQGVFLPGDLLA
jgi:hypothetical protein